MSGHPQHPNQGHYDDGYGQHPQHQQGNTDSYYQDDHNQGYYDNNGGYADNQQGQNRQGGDGYYDESYGLPFDLFYVSVVLTWKQWLLQRGRK